MNRGYEKSSGETPLSDWSARPTENPQTPVYADAPLQGQCGRAAHPIISVCGDSVGGVHTPSFPSAASLRHSQPKETCNPSKARRAAPPPRSKESSSRLQRAGTMRSRKPPLRRKSRTTNIVGIIPGYIFPHSKRDGFPNLLHLLYLWGVGREDSSSPKNP